MPAFGGLSDYQLTALVHFFLGIENKHDLARGEEDPQAKYHFTGYDKFLDPDGYPAVKPPWGTLNAINLDTGEYVWKIPFGEYPELAAKGIKNTGSENYGGPAVTASGLIFIGATVHDKKFRAYDKSTGELLWETTLPFSANGTPAVYEINGRQFVAIGAGGGRWVRMPSGGVYVAFALPQ
jgi:quinoprotein glucose dehydrogenase